MIVNIPGELLLAACLLITSLRLYLRTNQDWSEKICLGGSIAVVILVIGQAVLK